jgi:hypothetical protein
MYWRFAGGRWRCGRKESKEVSFLQKKEIMASLSALKKNGWRAYQAKFFGSFLQKRTAFFFNLSEALPA